MQQDSRKQRAADAALEHVGAGEVIGVGTGSTVNFFIDGLARLTERPAGAVSSSEASSRRLEAHGIPVLDLNEVGELALYVDGADEATPRLELIKGGGGALTREKIVAAASRRFVCIVDESKLVERLGRFPLPVEVIPMARQYVARELSRMGGRPVWRADVLTDNGNHILDVHDLAIPDPAAMEQELNQITGVVCVGLFARRPADILLVGKDEEVVTLRRGA
jgi:ribose 5-phosphate isomerase A